MDETDLIVIILEGTLPTPSDTYQCGTGFKPGRYALSPTLRVFILFLVQVFRKSLKVKFHNSFWATIKTSKSGWGWGVPSIWF